MPDRFSGTGPDPVSVGEELSIQFSNPDQPNQTVTIAISNGEGQEETVQVELDAEGKGTHAFLVPAGWDSVFLNEPSSLEHVVAVV